MSNTPPATGNKQTGKVYFIGKAANNGTTKINVQVPNGNYVIEITDGKNTISRKITILN